MKGYLSIGKVSKLKNVSIKSLRYYDEIGVLKPAYINPATGYRYYTEEQMFLLDAIVLCLELGIPLKDLSKYVADGKINLQELLYDGKNMAETKIKKIRSCLSQLHSCLESYEHKPISINQSKVYDRKIPERKILAQPIPEDSTTEDLSRKILRLFMLAQLLGIKVSYPSGLIYDYDNNTLTKSVFVTIEDVGECEDKRIRVLPEGYYVCHQHENRSIFHGQNIFASFLNPKKKQSVIETDLMDDSIRTAENNMFELQLFVTSKKRTES